MTTEEKLQNFYTASIESAQKDAQALLDEHKAALDKIFQEHQEMKNRQAEAELKAEADKIKRETNKKISAAQLAIKRSLSKKQEDLKEQLFVEVRNKLTAYMDTPDYEQFLYQKCRQAMEFAAGEEVILYIDQADSIHQHSLMQKLGVKPELSREIFMGGMRAVIPSKNILIDNSFKTLLADTQARFTFQDGGMKQ